VYTSDILNRSAFFLDVEKLLSVDIVVTEVIVIILDRIKLLLTLHLVFPDQYFMSKYVKELLH
jgi:hypothetical protein